MVKRKSIRHHHPAFIPPRYRESPFFISCMLSLPPFLMLLAIWMDVRSLALFPKTPAAFLLAFNLWAYAVLGKKISTLLRPRLNFHAVLLCFGGWVCYYFLLKAWLMPYALSYLPSWQYALVVLCRIVLIITALTVLVDLKRCMPLVKQHRKASLIAFVAATAALTYRFLNPLIWSKLTAATGWILLFLLNASGISTEIGSFDVTMNGEHKQGIRLLIENQLGANLNYGCSGVEGICLLLFLVSLLVLLDFRIFKKVPLMELYLSIFVYMFTVNCLRIFSIIFFSIKGSGDIKAIDLAKYFHSYTGLVYYFISFVLYAAVLYALYARSGTKRKR